MHSRIALASYARSEDARWLRSRFYKDQVKPIAELDGSGNLVGRFAYGSKKAMPHLVMTYNGGVVTTYRVFSDHLGSPLKAVNAANSTSVPFSAEYCDA